MGLDTDEVKYGNKIDGIGEDMIRQQIYEDLKQAMKARETLKLEALRFIWSEIKNKEIDAKHELADDEVVAVLAREVKRRKEALEQFRQAGRDDLVESEGNKLQTIESYLPQMMNREEIESVVREVVAGGNNQFGAVMSQVMGRVKGKADGGVVKQVVEELLTS